MNDHDIDALQILLNTESMMVALRKVFKEVVEGIRPSIETGDDDVLLGQKYRAFDTSVEITSKVFDQLEKYRKPTMGQGVDKRHI